MQQITLYGINSSVQLAQCVNGLHMSRPVLQQLSLFGHEKLYTHKHIYIYNYIYIYMHKCIIYCMYAYLWRGGGARPLGPSDIYCMVLFWCKFHFYYKLIDRCLKYSLRLHCKCHSQYIVGMTSYNERIFRNFYNFSMITTNVLNPPTLW